jgi:multicomponent Na+:H+ antiporter subunit D
MFNHALIKGGLFLATGCIVFRLGSSEIEDLRGVGRMMPVTMFAWVIGGLGLIGVPITAGFVTKWYLLRAAFEAGFWPVAMLVLFSSLIAVVYVWRVVELAYFGKPSRELAGIREAPLSLLVPTCVVLALTLWFGLDADFPASVASAAAAALLGSGP